MADHLPGMLPGHQPDAAAAVGLAWGWRAVAATLLLTVAAALGLGLLGRGLAATFDLAVEDRLISPVVYLVGLGVYGAVVLGVYLFAARRAGWAALGLRPFSERSAALIPLIFILGMATLILVNLLLTAAVGEFENPQVEALSGGKALGAGELLALLMLVALVAPFVEELFFRGMVYPLMRARLGPAPAIILNALVFALIHLIGVLIPGLFVVGLALAYLRERSGSIWPSVIYHVMQNSLALLAINAVLTGS